LPGLTGGKFFLVHMLSSNLFSAFFMSAVKARCYPL
jgi:hypothetical protein